MTKKARSRSPTERKSPRKVSPKGHRKPNAYNNFVGASIRQQRKADPNAVITTCMKKAARAWKGLSAAEQAKWA